MMERAHTLLVRFLAGSLVAATAWLGACGSDGVATDAPPDGGVTIDSGAAPDGGGGIPDVGAKDVASEAPAPPLRLDSGFWLLTNIQRTRTSATVSCFSVLL